MITAPKREVGRMFRREEILSPADFLKVLIGGPGNEAQGGRRTLSELP